MTNGNPLAMREVPWLACCYHGHMNTDPRHERFDIPHSDILSEDVWAEENGVRADTNSAHTPVSADARCPRCGAAVDSRAIRCPACERKLPQCGGSCSMCGHETCLRSVGDGKP